MKVWDEAALISLVKLDRLGPSHTFVATAVQEDVGRIKAVDASTR